MDGEEVRATADEAPGSPWLACWSGISIPRADPTITSTEQVRIGLRELERLSREVAAASALLIGRLGSDRRDEVPDAARALGVSNREAFDRLKIAAAIRALPALGDALANGYITTEHIRLLSRVASHPDALSLLALAQIQTPEIFRQTVLAFEIAHDGDRPVAERQRAKRYLRFYDAPDGMVGLHGHLPPIDGARFRAALDQIVEQNFRNEQQGPRGPNRSGDSRQEYGARRVDALVGVVCGDGAEESVESGERTDTDAPKRTKSKRRSDSQRVAVILTISLDTGRANLLGHGPVPWKSAIDLATSPAAELFGAIVNSEGSIVSLARDHRFPDLLQRLVVSIRDERCVYPNCSKPHTRCEIHHVIEHHDGGPTVVWNLVMLCDAHHHLLHDAKHHVKRWPNGVCTIHDANGTLVAGRPPPQQAAA
jgi:hypothetical protein